ARAGGPGDQVRKDKWQNQSKALGSRIRLAHTSWCRLRNGPVSWRYDLHSIPAVHPARLNVNSVFGRFPGFGGWCRRNLLNNDDWLLADSAHTTNKSKAVETV